MRGPILQTERLLLRRWCRDDRAALARINADPAVMEHFPATLSRAESDAFIDRIEHHFERRGFGLWAIELRRSGAMLGFTGLAVPSFVAPFMPAVEIGWRLGKAYWGNGYAPEAARAALRFAFDPLGLDEVVSFTVPANLRSRRVMEKLGMRRRCNDDFEHPLLPDGHPLRRHVLYRISSERWFAGLRSEERNR